jgi:hypothetical protein
LELIRQQNTKSSLQFGTMRTTALTTYQANPATGTTSKHNADMIDSLGKLKFRTGVRNDFKKTDSRKPST